MSLKTRKFNRVDRRSKGKGYGIRMKDKHEKETIVQKNSVELWWLHKLDTRETVPACAQDPTESRIHKLDNYPVAWHQLSAFDYLELSYENYCLKHDLAALDKDDFHEAFLAFFTDDYNPPVINARCFGFRKYIDRDPVEHEEYMEVLCYFLPSVYFCRALFELSTGSEPIDWLDGRRMKESYKGSPAFWRELYKNKIYQDNFPQYGDKEFTPDYIDVVHGSRL